MAIDISRVTKSEDIRLLYYKRFNSYHFIVISFPFMRILIILSHLHVNTFMHLYVLYYMNSMYYIILYEHGSLLYDSLLNHLYHS